MTAVASTLCVVAAGAAVTAPAQAVVDPDKSVLVSKDDSIVLAEGFNVGEAVQVRLERNGVEIATSSGNAENLLGDGVGMFEVNHAAAPTQCWDDPATPEILAGDHVFVSGEAGQVAEVTVSDLEVTQGPTQTGPSSGTVKGIFLGAPLPDISELSVETRALAGGGGARLRAFAPGESSGENPGVTGTIAYDTGPGAVSGAFTATFTGFNAQQMGRFLDSFEVAATHMLPAGNEGTIAVLGAAAGSEDPLCPPAERRAVTSLSQTSVNVGNAGNALTVGGVTAAGEEVVVSMSSTGGGTAPAPVQAVETGTTWTAEFPAGALAGLGDGTITVSGDYGSGPIGGATRTLTKDTSAPSAPAISPAGGTFVGSRTIALNAGGEPVRYTTDGSQPTAGSALYSGPITLTRTATLKAMAIDTAGNTGPTSSASFRRATVTSRPVIGTASAGRIGGAATAFARWRAPASNGGLAVTRYEVSAERIASGRVVQRRTFLRTAATRSTQLSLTRGTWRFRVRAVNPVGKSAFSAYSNRTISR